MEGDHGNQEAAELMEDTWFFDNLLKRKAKIGRSYSDPWASSKKDEIFDAHKMNFPKPTKNLLKAPSLPTNFGKGKRIMDEEEEDDVYGPRMGDLIRQAMPCRLSKAPSLPIARAKKDVSCQTMSKLPRVSSLDPSLLNSSVHASKGMKQNLSDPNIDKSFQQTRSEVSNRRLVGKKDSKSMHIQRSMSLKSLSDKEVQGFQDLGFSFRKEDLCPAVVAKLARFNLKEETEEGQVGKKGKMNSSSVRNFATQTQWGHSPPTPKWIDTKSSAKDMKEQIKFWAKSVASNVQK